MSTLAPIIYLKGSVSDFKLNLPLGRLPTQASKGVRLHPKFNSCDLGIVLLTDQNHGFVMSFGKAHRKDNEQPRFALMLLSEGWREFGS